MTQEAHATLQTFVKMIPRCAATSCPNPGNTRVHACSRCHLIFYCDRICQKAGWKNHAGVCNPRRDVFEWKGDAAPQVLPLWCEGVGCGVVSTRRCSTCDMPICSDRCEQDERHQKVCVDPIACKMRESLRSMMVSISAVGDTVMVMTPTADSLIRTLSPREMPHNLVWNSSRTHLCIRACELPWLYHMLPEAPARDLFTCLLEYQTRTNPSNRTVATIQELRQSRTDLEQAFTSQVAASSNPALQELQRSFAQKFEALTSEQRFEMSQQMCFRMMSVSTSGKKFPDAIDATRYVEKFDATRVARLEAIFEQLTKASPSSSTEATPAQSRP